MTDTILAIARVRTACNNGEARRTRQAAHLPAATLAAELGVLPSTLSRWERGKAYPSGDDAVRYAAILDALAAL